MPREREEIETADGGTIAIERGDRGPTEEELRQQRSEKMAKLLNSRKLTARDLGLEETPYKSSSEVSRLREQELEAEAGRRFHGHLRQVLAKNDETALEKDEREARRLERMARGS